MDKLGKAELIDLVERIMGAEGTEEQQDEMLNLLERNVPHPGVSDLIYYTFPELTAEEIVERALALVTRRMRFRTWTDERRREWFEWCVENGGRAEANSTQWVICRADAGEVIGWFGIGSATHPTVPGERDFGYLLGRAHWGRGYMTEALRAVMAHEFDTRRTPRLSATCRPDNIASARVLEKGGMRPEKTVRERDVEGNWVERHYFVIDVNEYGATRA